MSQSMCPGKYCGILSVITNDSSSSQCGACPWGYRVEPPSVNTTAVGSSFVTASTASLCQQCAGAPSTYDWLYLGFMALLPLCLHFFFIDVYGANAGDKRNNHRRSRNSAVSSAIMGQQLVCLGSAVVECALSALTTLLIYEPTGSLALEACGVRELADWYTPLFNPSGGRDGELHCTQEAVYPLYTIVMVYYALDLLTMMLLRPMLAGQHVTKALVKRCPNVDDQRHGCCLVTGDSQRHSAAVTSSGCSQWPSSAIYAALYFLPGLVLLQAVLGGLLYYSYPYVTLVIFLITLAAHLSSYEEQSTLGLLAGSFKSPRNLCVIVGHCLAFAYGIVATTQALQEPLLTGLLLLLVPLPFTFYIVTQRFTAPDAVDSIVSGQAVSGEQQS